MSRLSNPAGVRINQPHFVHVVSATVRNTRLSYRALGLLVYLLDQKEGWQVRAEQLSKGEGREGREAIRTALRELQVAGHYRLERRRLRNGKCVMGTALSGTPLEQWVRDHEIFSTQKDPAVPVIEQEDGTFLVQYPDGSLGSDGFEPDPYADEEPPADEEPEEPTAAEESAVEEPLSRAAEEASPPPHCGSEGRRRRGEGRRRREEGGGEGGAGRGRGGGREVVVGGRREAPGQVRGKEQRLPGHARNGDEGPRGGLHPTAVRGRPPARA
ncbi:hypothetical protein R2F25_38160 [Streptomyces sp. UP1A-1]|nr:hypothetical protein [Streptomyces sp. UP1A-1]